MKSSGGGKPPCYGHGPPGLMLNSGTIDAAGSGPVGCQSQVPSQAYFSRMRAERSTSRIGSPSLSLTASMTEQAIIR